MLNGLPVSSRGQSLTLLFFFFLVQEFFFHVVVAD